MPTLSIRLSVILFSCAIASAPGSFSGEPQKLLDKFDFEAPNGLRYLRWWMGRDNTTLTEPTPSHARHLKGADSHQSSARCVSPLLTDQEQKLIHITLPS
jgi:hypothetical protein